MASNLTLPSSENESGRDAHKCLAAKLITMKIIGLNVVRSVLESAWKLRGRVSFSPLEENNCLVAFPTVSDNNRIVETSPWSVNGAHVMLKPWKEDMSLAEISFVYSPFWVQAMVFHLISWTLRVQKSSVDLRGSFFRQISIIKSLVLTENS
ncbi:hypothetical protein M9H77_06477 [Catharanthus roseus]|uniref:Uncharacterized protein n=1 Tax=Catharanthus roseus TaxID=4058 RepID=A0ACC0BSH8_CATRO|nr:hypothetical protein M9H77_06477 [Catharanthus roseus]